MLCHLLIFLQEQYKLPDLKFPDQTKKNLEIRHIYLQSYKKNYSLSRMCQNMHMKDQGIFKFCMEVEKMGFNEKPEYSKLKQIFRYLIQFEMQQEFISKNNY